MQEVSKNVTAFTLLQVRERFNCPVELGELHRFPRGDTIRVGDGVYRKKADCFEVVTLVDYVVIWDF